MDRYGPGVLRGDVFRDAATMEERSRRAATGLRSLGVGAGDTVGVLLRNDHPFFEVSFAAAAVGAAPVPVNWHGSADEIGYVLQDCKAKVLVAHADLLHGLGDALPAGIQVVVVPTPDDIAAAYGIDPDRQRPAAGLPQWDEWLAGFEPVAGDLEANPASVIYTSGTTGRPKGVRRLTPDGDEESVRLLHEDVARVFGVTPDMRTVVTGPLYHVSPNTYSLAAVRLGGFVALQVRFDPEDLLRLVEEHRIKQLNVVPTMFVRLLRLDEATRSKYDVSSLEHVVHGAAPCPPDVKRAMIDWWGPVLYEYYGSTETAAVVACTSEEWLAHPGTVGRPLRTASVRVYDDAGRRLEPGEVGEIFVRIGGIPDFTYEGKPDARAEVERDGLITCGDLGYLDEDGFLYLCDRKRDMVISGGVNIYPAEVEAALMGLDGVADCAVFGIPDEEFGESLAAAVQALPGAELTADDVRAHIAGRLARFKVPKVVTFHDQLPREDSGKIFKRKLRDPYWESVGRAI